MNKPEHNEAVKKLSTISYMLGRVTIKSRLNQETGETCWDLFNEEFGDFFSLQAVDLKDLRDVLNAMKKDKVM